MPLDRLIFRCFIFGLNKIVYEHNIKEISIFFISGVGLA